MAYRHRLNFWPLVPAVDIQAVFEAVHRIDIDDQFIKNLDIPFVDFQTQQTSSSVSNSNCHKEETLNVLIVGDGLGCLIKTISRMYRYETLHLNIYIVSNFAESLVRNLLLLSLLSECHPSIGILEKTENFLEIFGNTLLRASTSSFVETKAADILDDITLTRQEIKSIPFVSFSFLKQKEIDEICEVLLFLKNNDHKYDISKAWENALRSYYGVRFDSRKNLFDYHYNMKLSQYPIINLKKYLEWCETGISFKLRKGKYDTPNKTLCVESLLKNQSSEYYGDIATSPYIAFGVECKNDDMFKTANHNEYAHTSEDISKFNVIDFMTEFTTSKKIHLEKNQKVYFLFYPTFCKTQKFKNFFDAIYITCDMTSYAEKGTLEKILDDKGVVVFETVNNVVNSTKDHKAKHVNDIIQMAEKNNLMLAKDLKCVSENFKVFVRKGETELKKKIDYAMRF